QAHYDCNELPHGPCPQFFRGSGREAPIFPAIVCRTSSGGIIARNPRPPRVMGELLLLWECPAAGAMFPIVTVTGRMPHTIHIHKKDDSCLTELGKRKETLQNDVSTRA